MKAWSIMLAVLIGALSVQGISAAKEGDPTVAPGLAQGMIPTSGIMASDGQGGPSEVFVEPHERILSSSRPLGLPAVIDAERQMLEETWGTIPELPSARQGSSTEMESAEGESYPKLRLPITPGDVNGDRQEDVVFFEVGLDADGYRTSAGVGAIDGRTGQPLWSNEYGNPFDMILLNPRDLTGDASDDLLVVVVTLEHACVVHPELCYQAHEFRYVWDIALISGATGSEVWERTIQGSVKYTGTGGGVQVRHYEATNVFVDVRRSPDLNGDGLDDLVLNVHDYEGVWIHQFYVREWEGYQYTSRGEAIAGHTGETLVTRSAPDPMWGAAELVPAGEATGDGLADLLWSVPSELRSPNFCLATPPCVEHKSLQLHLELIDSASKETRWGVDVVDEGLTAAGPVLSGEDLTGDGRADVLLGLTLADGSHQVTRISGADGERDWTLDTILTDTPTALSDIGGEAGNDFLLWEGWEPTQTEAPGVWFRIRLRRIDGATGQELFATQHDLVDKMDTGETIWALPAGDVDGDGSQDISHAAWHSTPPWEEDGTASSVLRVESGADGTQILRTERDSNSILYPGGDLVPGGALDLLEISLPYDASSFALSGIEVPTGRLLWKYKDVLTYAIFGSLQDRSGGGDDVAYARFRGISDAPKIKARVDVIEGETGSLQWGVGSPF